jgi:predicted aminopeptidase
VLYVKGDTSFNESFATAIEELGIERWLEREGTEAEFERWQGYKAWSEDLTRIALEARDDLEALFASDLDDAAKRAAKAARLDALTDALLARASEAGVDARGWWQDQPLNNARLASWSAYESYVPAFRQLFIDCDEDFDCLYRRAGELAELPGERREARIDALVASAAERDMASVRGAE